MATDKHGWPPSLEDALTSDAGAGTRSSRRVTLGTHGGSASSLLARAALVGVAYFACAELGRLITVRQAFTFLWPPSGLLVAALLLTRTREWPVVATAAFMANIAFDAVHGTALSTSVLFAAGNLAEGLVGAALTRRFVAYTPTFTDLRQVVGFGLASPLLSTAVSASVGTTVVALTAGASDHLSTWALWWSADAMGVLVVAPLVFTWYEAARDARGRALLRRTAPILAAAAALAATMWTLGTWAPPWFEMDQLVTLVFLGAAGLGSGPLGVTTVGVPAALMAAWHASRGMGAAASASAHALVNAQLSIAIAIFAGLVLGAAFAERERAHGKLRALVRAVWSAEENAARKLAVDLHDGVGQQLAMAKLYAQQAHGSRDPLVVRESCAHAAELLDEASTGVRRLVAGLSSTTLMELGLAAALDELCIILSDACGLDCSVRLPVGGLPRLEPAVEGTLLRVARELLTNTAKHAAASRVGVEVSIDGGLCRLIVSDDGRRFDPADASAPAYAGAEGFGLFSVRERLAAAGGTLEIGSAPGKGTRVTVLIPLDDPDAQDDCPERADDAG